MTYKGYTLRQLNELTSLDSVIFDLDGTLWDASLSATRSWNKALETIGYINNVITQEDLKAVTGIKIEEILKSNYGFMTDNEKIKFLEVFEQIEADEMKSNGGVLYNNVENVLKVLKKRKKLFIVSNCLKGYIENFLEFTKLTKYFDGYESTGNTGKSKDSNIKKIIENYKLEQPVYIGDTEHDYEASENNSIPFIYAEYGFGKAAKATFSIREFTDLLKLNN